MDSLKAEQISIVTYSYTGGMNCCGLSLNKRLIESFDEPWGYHILKSGHRAFNLAASHSHYEVESRLLVAALFAISCDPKKMIETSLHAKNAVRRISNIFAN